MLLVPNHHNRLALYKANQSVMSVYAADECTNIDHERGSYPKIPNVQRSSYLNRFSKRVRQLPETNHLFSFIECGPRSCKLWNGTPAMTKSGVLSSLASGFDQLDDVSVMRT